MYTDGQIAISLGKALFGLGGNKIFKAVKKNDYNEFVKAYRDNPDSIFDVDDEENTLLLQVCVGAIDKRIIDWVISHTAKKSDFVNLRNQSKMTALMTSIVLNNEYAFDKILNKYSDLDVNKVNHKQSKTALDFAYISGNKSMVSRLLEKKATPYLDRTPQEQSKFEAEIRNNYNKHIQVASEQGDLETVANLIDKGTDITIADDSGMTLLHRASEKGHLDIVKLLVMKGGIINARTKYGEAALHFASKGGFFEIVKFFIEKGINVNIQTIGGETPLYYASMAGKLETVKLLIENEAAVNVKIGEYRYTSLHMASAQGHSEIVKLLIANKADINAKDVNGETPLDFAKKKNRKKIISIFSDGILGSGNWGPYLGKMKWEDAKTKCASIGKRLPTIEELKSAFSTGVTKAWNEEEGGAYWSSTPAGNDRAYWLHIFDGSVCEDNRSDYAYVRCYYDSDLAK